MLRDAFHYDGVWNGDDLFHRVPKPRERFRAFDHFRVRLHDFIMSDQTTLQFRVLGYGTRVPIERVPWN